MSWLWLWCGLLGIILGAIMLAAADASKPKYESGPYSSYTASMSGTYAALVAVGIILLLAGRLKQGLAQETRGLAHLGPELYCHILGLSCTVTE